MNRAVRASSEPAARAYTASTHARPASVLARVSKAENTLVAACVRKRQLGEHVASKRRCCFPRQAGHSGVVGEMPGRQRTQVCVGLASVAPPRLHRSRRPRGCFARRPAARLGEGRSAAPGQWAYCRIARIRQSGPALSLVVLGNSDVDVPPGFRNPYASSTGAAAPSDRAVCRVLTTEQQRAVRAPHTTRGRPVRAIARAREMST